MALVALFGAGYGGARALDGRRGAQGSANRAGAGPDQGLAGIDGVQVTNDPNHPPDDYADASFRAQRAEIRLKSRRGRQARASADGAIVVDSTRRMYMRLRDRAGNVTRWKRIGR
jgi:hypothetical protein